MSLRHAILGILSIQPMSGYDLKKVVNGSVGHFWTADQSQIYRTLATLVTDGLATRRTVPQDDRPNRHVHSITDAGTEQLSFAAAGTVTAVNVEAGDAVSPGDVLATIDSASSTRPEPFMAARQLARICTAWARFKEG
jgi:DNA-binding PadR family transcriptional regulator